jgi:hypothetical protein
LAEKRERNDRRNSYSVLVAVLVHRVEEAAVDESGDENG